MIDHKSWRRGRNSFGKWAWFGSDPRTKAEKVEMIDQMLEDLGEIPGGHK